MSAAPVLILAYVVAAHSGVVYGQPLPALGVLMLVAGLSIRDALRDGARGSALIALLALLALIALAVTGAGAGVLYLPPLLIPLAMLHVFARSLRGGRTPLVTRFAQLIDGELPPQVAAYTRSVTVAWVVFLALLVLETLVLMLVAPPAVWSLFANALNYVFIGAFFLIEFAVRRRVLPQRTQGGLVHFLRAMARLDMRRALRNG
jgi:uncharacterized membrane protein